MLFTSVTALLAALAQSGTERQLAQRLQFYDKSKLLIVDELGICRSNGAARTSSSSSWHGYTRGSMLITTNQLVTQWGTVLGEVLAAAPLDRLLHHSHTLIISPDRPVGSRHAVPVLPPDK